MAIFFLLWAYHPPKNAWNALLKSAYEAKGISAANFPPTEICVEGADGISTTCQKTNKRHDDVQWAVWSAPVMVTVSYFVFFACISLRVYLHRGYTTTHLRGLIAKYGELCVGAQVNVLGSRRVERGERSIGNSGENRDQSSWRSGTK